MKLSSSPGNTDSDSETEPELVSQNTGMPSLSTLGRTVSPPPVKRSTKTESNTITDQSLAAIEAGQVEITDHLETISANLKRCVRSTAESTPRLPMSDFMDLYRRNDHDEGCHFVIHQHDHPLAGPHYDLRLQFSKTSSVSWSIMYGLPGDPNSQKLNRNATETRVHCLWVRKTLMMYYGKYFILIVMLLEPSSRDCVGQDRQPDNLGYWRVRNTTIRKWIPARNR